MKKIIFVFGFLSITLCFATFSDVPTEHPNHEAIMWAQDQGIIEGYEDGTFRPDEKINRAEFTKIILENNFELQNINKLHDCQIEYQKGADLCNSRGGCMQTAYTNLKSCLEMCQDQPSHSDCELANSYKNCFLDIEKDKWYANYICYAKIKNIISGYPDGTFKPDQNISFVESAKIITNAFGSDLEADEKIWYKNYVQELSNKKAIPVSIDKLDQEITRGEAVEMIWRVDLSTRKILPHKKYRIYKNNNLVKGWGTYENNKLSIKFDYLPNQALNLREDNNKITFVYKNISGERTEREEETIEVFFKLKTDTLEQAITKNFFETEKKQNICKIKVYEDAMGLKAIIDLQEDFKTSIKEEFKNVFYGNIYKKYCGKYAEYGSPAYFFFQEDKNPNKFVFIRLGQAIGNLFPSTIAITENKNQKTLIRSDQKAEGNDSEILKGADPATFKVSKN